MYKKIKIGEKEFEIRLTLDALSEFKVLNNGIGIVGLMADIQTGRFTFDVDETILLFHLGAKHGGGVYEKTLAETRKMFEKTFEEEGFDFFDDVSSTLLVLLSEGKKKARLKTEQLKKLEKEKKIT